MIVQILNENGKNLALGGALFISLKLVLFQSKTFQMRYIASLYLKEVMIYVKPANLVVLIVSATSNEGALYSLHHCKKIINLHVDLIEKSFLLNSMKKYKEIFSYDILHMYF